MVSVHALELRQRRGAIGRGALFMALLVPLGFVIGGIVTVILLALGHR